MKASDLTPAPYNPRKITDKKLAMLQKSMAEFGDLSGIVMNTRTGHLIGGHQRLKVFSPDWPIHKEPHEDVQGTVALGFVETPWDRWVYREVDWDETKEKAANWQQTNMVGNGIFLCSLSCWWNSIRVRSIWS